MIRKGLLCDEVLRMLSKFAYNRSENLFDRRDVGFHLNGGVGAAAKSCWQGLYNDGEKGTIDPGFLTTYEEVPVLFSKARGLYYSNLPALPISMEGGMGLYEIAPMKDQSSAFIIQRPGADGLFKGLAAEKLFGEYGAKQEGFKVWYKNINTGSQDITSVLMNIVADTSELSMDDYIPLPADYQSIVVDYCFKQMSVGRGLPDSKIDANPTSP